MKKFNNPAFWRLFKYVWKYWYDVVLVLAMAFVGVFASLYSVILIGDAIDVMVDGSVDFTQLWKIVAIIAGLTVVYMVVEWLTEVFAARITYKAVKDIRQDVFDTIQNVPLSYLDSHKTGELLSIMVVDVDQISDGLILALTQFFTGVATVIGTIIIMMSINYKIGLIVVLITPVSLVLAGFISKMTRKHFKKQSDIRGEIASQVQDAVSAQTLYKTCSYLEKSEEVFEKTNEDLEKVSIKAIFMSSLPNPTSRFVNNIIYALTGLVGALAVIGGGAFMLTVGQLTMFLTYAQKYAKPFNSITDVLTEIESATASAERVFGLMDAVRELPDSNNALVLKDVDGTVELNNVSFSYVKNKELIKGLNLKAKPGQNIAIVGRTGCGKTTLINLLMRFYDVDDGEIKVSGHNINDMTRDSLRTSYGMVLQDSYIFVGTIRDNIKFGREASDEEVIEAAEKARAYSFIKRQPQGLDTVISENSNLSEGQRQLLCIARAMLHLPQMLILDEATSSVDTRTEIKIQQAFDAMMKDRTCFVVAHRLSTIKNADMILVMDKGHIIEQGTHEELLKSNGFYTELYNSQFAQK